MNQLKLNTNFIFIELVKKLVAIKTRIKIKIKCIKFIRIKTNNI
jgi:hypothetical protein